MKKLGKSSKKGFTLVELIVVLVILAVLAAMLIPALVGYIDKAKAEKDYQAAATALTAAQSLATEAYGRDKDIGDVLTLQGLKDLAGLDKISDFAYDVVDSTATDGKAFTITNFSVTFDGTTWYNYTQSTNTWAPGTAATAGAGSGSSTDTNTDTDTGN